MTVPARCNRRSCQARRNLPKRPHLYVRWPACHVAGCTGAMYVDEYRLRKGARDNAPACRDEACGFAERRMRAGGSFVPFHRVSTVGCDHYEDYVIERAAVGSKHCPNKPEGPESAPF